MTAQNSLIENNQDLPQVLVVGGAGFIGSFICSSLLQKNLRVIALDDLITGDKRYLENLLPNPNFVFLKENINDFTPPAYLKPSYIFHLAGVEEYINGLDVSMETLLVNSFGTKKILDLAKEHQCRLLTVSSLSVYEGALSNFSLSSDFGLSPKEMQKYTHHEAKRFSEAITSEYFKKYKLDIRVVRIRDCYGPHMPLVGGSLLGKFISQVLEKKDLEIEGDGLELLNPTFVTDLVNGLEKAMFGPETTGKIFSLASPKQYTLLNLAFCLQKLVNYPLKIKFLPSSTNFQFPKKQIDIEKTVKDLGWNPAIDIEEGFKKTLHHFTDKKIPVQNISPVSKVETVKENIVPEAPVAPIVPALPVKSPVLKAEKKSLLSNIGLVKHFFFPALLKTKLLIFVSSFLIVFSLLLFPLLYLGFQTFRGFVNLDSSVSELKKGKWEEGKKKAIRAEQYFVSARKNLQNQYWFFTMIGQRKNTSFLLESYEMGESAGRSLETISRLGENILSLRDDFTYGFSKKSLTRLNLLSLDLSDLSKEISLIEVVSGGRINFCPDRFKTCSYLQKILAELPAFKKSLNQLTPLSGLLPEILASKTPKNYLILLQNNMELRGGGGFIGSVALLSFDQGKIVNFRIDDSYSLDGQLKGQVNPPDEILHFLGQPNWYLRDSNFSPDFSLSAQRAAWFFEKETDLAVDGVIAIDLSFLKLVLSEIGSVKLSDYPLEINSENLFSEAQKEAEKKFFPGSTQKKDFLYNLANKIILDFIDNKNPPYLSLISAFKNAISEKHLMIYFSNQKIQSFVEDSGLSGTVKDQLCETKDACVASFSQQIDNNYGANKANYYLKKDISRKIIIGRDGDITETFNLSFKNESPSITWPGGNYKNYFKFYAPKGSKLLSLDLGDSKKATISSELTAKSLKVKKNEFFVLESSESGKTSWSALLNVPIKSTKKVNITYLLPQKLVVAAKNPVLEIFQQKQNGAQNDPFSLLVEFPSFLKVKKFEVDNISKVANSPVVSYNSFLSSDKKFILEFY